MAIEVNNDYETLRTLEIDLRAELEAVDLVGELDLDYWGPTAEELLKPVAGLKHVREIRRRWPATFVAYLVYQGIKNDEDRFWDSVSIYQFRKGSLVGPEFIDGLKQLDLAVFDDLEELEGLKEDSSGRYLRRIFLHGGIPARAVKHVVELLAASLRAGAISSQEVLEQWESLDLRTALKSHPAARCFLYTGQHAERLVDQLIDLMRISRRGPNPTNSSAPSHLQAGIKEYLENPPPSTWAFKPGPVVRVDPNIGQPFLEVPAAKNVRWFINDEYVGDSSWQTTYRFHLPFNQDGIWQVSSQDHDGDRLPRSYYSEAPAEVVLIFDENGKLHRRGRTLSGLRAYMVAPDGTEVETEIERRILHGDWQDFELITLDLRNLDELLIPVSSGEVLSISVSNTWEMYFHEGLVDGLRCEGEEVLTGQVIIGFKGHAPDPQTIRVKTALGTVRLSDCDRIWGGFDITASFNQEFVQETNVRLIQGDDHVRQRRVFYIPKLELDRLNLAGPQREIPIAICFRDGKYRCKASTTISPDADKTNVRFELRGKNYDFEIKQKRLLWDLYGRGTSIILHDQEAFSVRLPDLKDQVLSLRTGGYRVNVALLDAGPLHVEKAKQHRVNSERSIVEIRAFSDTARHASVARCRLAVVGQNVDPIIVGLIETRYEPVDLIADPVALADGTPALEVSWQEYAAWEDREVRIWNAATNMLVANQPVPDGVTEAQIVLNDVPEGIRHVVEVAVADEWTTPKPPIPGAGSVNVFLGSPLEQRLSEVVFNNERVVFTDDELDEATSTLASLLIERINSNASYDEITILREFITSDNLRVVEVITELFDQLYSNDDETTVRLVEKYLWGLLPGLWVDPVNQASTGVRNVQLEYLWEIAPMAAACFDQLSDSDGNQDEGRKRWEHAVGFTHELPPYSTSPLEQLTNWPVDPIVKDKPTTLLGVAAWHAAIEELMDGSARGANWQVIRPHMELVERLENRCRGLKPPPWRHIARRVDHKLNHLNPNAKWLGRLVMLSCELLKPVLQPKKLVLQPKHEAKVLAALCAIHRVYPQATRTAFVYSATALRIRESVGPAGDLVQ